MKSYLSVIVRAAFSIFVAVLLGAVAPGQSLAQDKKPNILVIWGDDIGQSNISAYTMGLVGYLLRLANRPRVPAGARSGLRGEFPANLQGIPAAAEGGLLLNRSGDGNAADKWRLEVAFENMDESAPL